MTVRATHVTTGLQSWATGASYVAHENKLETLAPVLTASSTLGEFSPDLVATWFSGNQKWKASAATSPQWLRAQFATPVPVNCLALYGHNLGSIGATIRLRYSNSGFSSMSDFATLTPAGDATIMHVRRVAKKVEAITATHWELRIENASAPPVVSIWFLGEAVRCYSGPPDGFRPPTLDRNDEILNNRSEGGEFLGRSLIRTGGRGRIEVKYMPPSWARAVWEPVRLAARWHPIFWAWNLDSYPDEAVLFYTDKADRGPSYMAGSGLMEHAMEGIAL